VVGTPYDVQGWMRGPIQHRASFLGVDAARLSQVWPRMGGLAQVPDGDLGVFYGRGTLKGSWMIPPGMRSQVTVGALKAKTTVDLAVPPLPDASTVAWDQAGPIAPSVRLTDVDEMASAQNQLTTAGIALGIGGSLLASLLFEAVRGRKNVALPPCSAGLPSPAAALPAPVPALLSHPDRSRSSNITPASYRWAKLAVAAVGLLAVRGLWRRGRR
jgi:hypothetical protein